MATLQEVLQQHISQSGKSAKALAEEIGIGYAALLATLKKGTIPRRREDRLAVQCWLGVDNQKWNALVAAGLQARTAQMRSQSGRVPSQQQSDESGEASLQTLVAQAMYAHGYTEQTLSEVSGIPYPTVLGVTRRGTIPRETAVNKLADVLHLEGFRIADAIEASLEQRKHAETQEDHEPEPIQLAQVVSDFMQARNQSIGALARDLGVGYLALARFVETGIPPEGPKILQSLRKAMGMSPDYFQACLELSRSEPQPAEVPERDDLLPGDANPLQHALADFMRHHRLNLKSLARRADLSQVTVSRIVKQGQIPRRSTTHHKLQAILGMSTGNYQRLLDQSAPSAALTVRPEPEFEHLEEEDDPYLPHETDRNEGSPEESADTDTLMKLIRRLDERQREALHKFINTLL